MLNQKLKAARERKRWSIEKVAEEVGVSWLTYSRWEHGQAKPHLHNLDELCRVFKLEPEDLGFTQYVEPLPQGEGGDVTRDASEEKIGRRDFVQEVLGVTGVALLASNQWDNPETLGRILQALKKPSSVDEATLAHLTGITRHYWQLFANSAGFTRYFLLEGLSGHLRTLIQMLEHPLSTHIQNHLCILVSETTQIMGEILFDLNDNDTARIYYEMAIVAAKEAQNVVLQAVALGRKSFIPIYGEDVSDALMLLQQAHHLTVQNTPEITRAWLFAVEAEAQANMKEAYACSKALDQAEYFLDRVKPGETGYTYPGESAYARFSKTVLLGYRGVCYIRLRQPGPAQEALRESMASMDHGRQRHKSIILTDLALTYVQQNELEKACRYADQALTIMAQTRSLRTFQRILAFRRALEPWKSTSGVKNLDQQIATVRSSLSS